MLAQLNVFGAKSSLRRQSMDKPEEPRPVFTDIRMVDVAGQALRVGIRHGRSSSPPLVVFNGIGANLEMLEPFVAALDDIEVVAFDVPGIGGSPAPAIPYRYSRLVRLTDRLLTTLGYAGQVDVLGLSWGGMLAQQYAYANAERCRRLILAATSSGSIMLPGGISVVSQLADSRRYSDPDHFKRIAPKIYGGSLRDRPDLIDHHAQRLKPPQGFGYLYQLAALWGWTSLPWLHRLRQPTLILAGSDDPIVPLANAQMLAHLIRRSKLVTIDDGHLFLITRANEVAPVIRRFLTDKVKDDRTAVVRRGVAAQLERLARRLGRWQPRRAN
ncbi:MAG TPA: poly(3-hydroxyalkanoate) depolymerase [Xanthobacteraceae bacterium]|nr:poly(3-hydroxyalkanoate) depolymerase [Xanthobacteraceae bacterium]